MKGATDGAPQIKMLGLISIHAPVKGATIGLLKIKQELWNFNPRSREGSDTVQLMIISLVQNFNPRSREGSDPEQSV